MRRALSNPFTWLGVQALFFFLYLWTQGAFEPETTPDTPGYIKMSEGFILSKATLNDRRTFGYPLYLKSVSLLSGDADKIDTKVTVGHFLAHVLAVLVFCWGLHSIKVCGWRSLVLASTILYSGWQFECRFSLIMSDSLGMSLAVAAVGCFLTTVTQRPTKIRLIVMAGLVFAAYQVRPAYVFLVAWLPIMGTMLLANLAEPDVFRGSIWKSLTGWLTATLVPFIAFCSVRWIIVGHFGLVSFGGFNTLGLTAQFLTDDLLPQLSGDTRKLAEEIIKDRDNLSYVTFSKEEFTYTAVHPSDVALIGDQCNPVLYRVVGPLLIQRHGNDWIAMNVQAGELSRAIVRHRPRAYCVYCVSAAKFALTSMRGYWHVYKPTYALIAAVMLYYIIRVVDPRGGRLVALDEAEWRVVSSSFIIAVGFLVLGTAVVVLGSVPLDRLIVPATIFLPLIPVSLLTVVIPRWFRISGREAEAQAS